MSTPSRVLVPTLLGLAILARSPATLGDEPENLRQIQAMPRERRVALSENLERFDKLDSTERAAIRKLDGEIARKDPAVQAGYRSLLRKYHLWVNGLTDEQKAQLAAAGGVEERINLVRTIRNKQKQEAGSAGPKVFGIRTGYYGVIGPYETAHILRIWELLTPADRVVLERLRPRSRIIDDLKTRKRPILVPFQAFPNAEEKFFDNQLTSDDSFKKQLGDYARRIDATPKKREAPTEAEPHQKRFDYRFTEFLYFEKNKPKSVKQENLERYSAACPGWLHEILDPLSADDARGYLTILYRLRYPEPGEMPPEVKSDKAPPATPTPAPKPGSNKPNAGSPF